MKTYTVDVFHIPERRRLRMMVLGKNGADAMRKANRLFNRNPEDLVSKAAYVACGVRGVA